MSRRRLELSDVLSEYITRVVKTRDEFEAVSKWFEDADVLALDFETASLVDKSVWGTVIGRPPCGDSKGIAVYLVTEEAEGVDLDFRRDILPWLEGFFVRDQAVIVGQNLSFDLQVLSENGCVIYPKHIFDVMIADWMLAHHISRRRSLDVIAHRWLKLKIDKDLMDIRQYRGVDWDKYWTEMERYAAVDAIVPLMVRERLKERLSEESTRMLRAAAKLEMPLVSVVSEMEMVGFRVDRRKLFELKAQAEEAVAEAQQKFNELIGYEVNIGSDQQVAAALFDPDIGLGFDTTEVPVGKSGVYSVSTTVLSRFDHPAVSLILQYRASKKLLSTYILPLLERSFGSRGAIIKARWNQTGTETGRFSSSSPNMQNFPRGDDSIRGAILPPRDDMVCVACDLSQIELRLMAHQSRCPVLSKLYREGADVHSATAAAAAGKRVEDVTKEERQLAKAINFGFLYGMSANKFMIYSRANYGVEVSEDDAVKFRSDYFRMYPGIQEYHNYMRQYIYERGYAENIIGERRYLPTHRSDDSYDRWRAWSEGVNYTIQGSAAAIIKLAMLKISRSLYRPFGRAVHPDFGRVVTCWGTDRYDPNREVYMFAQVHDELDFFVSEAIAEDFAKWVKYVMETVVTLRVPVEAEYGIGRTFGDAK